MKLTLIANIITCVCAFTGFIYGSIKFFRPKKAIYPQMITLAVGCMAFGKLYQLVRILTGGDIYGEFQLGIFGVIGSLMFLFSANYGAVDRLADDHSKKYSKYRLLALAAPLVALVFHVLLLLRTNLPVFAQIIASIVSVLVMHASYYHLKHLIFPDVDYGLIKCLKPYNRLALLYSFLCMAEMYVIGIGNETGILVVSILIGIVLVGIVFAAERGIKKWTI